MFSKLGEMESHVFQCINPAAVHEELEDESRRLCDIRPFLPVLKLVMRNCGQAERLLDSKIGVLIGKGKVAFAVKTSIQVSNYHSSAQACFCLLSLFHLEKALRCS